MPFPSLPLPPPPPPMDSCGLFSNLHWSLPALSFAALCALQEAMTWRALMPTWTTCQAAILSQREALKVIWRLRAPSCHHLISFLSTSVYVEANNTFLLLGFVSKHWLAVQPGSRTLLDLNLALSEDICLWAATASKKFYPSLHYH